MLKDDQQWLSALPTQCLPNFYAPMICSEQTGNSPKKTNCDVSVRVKIPILKEINSGT